MRPFRVLLATAMAGLMLAATAQVAHAEPTRTVGIRITHVECWPHDDDTCLEAFGEGEPDFYAKVFFPDGPKQTPVWGDSSDIRPNWVETEDIPASQTSLPMAIQIWDHDSTSSDDLADVTPRSGDRGSNLEFTVNVPTFSYSGDINSPQTCAHGNGDGDDDVEVCFELVLSANGDADGDGLSDSEEILGVDANQDGVIDFRPQGANYLHKDVYVESDWMTHPATPTTPAVSYAPPAGALTDVATAFANAPVSNPDGRSGVTLHPDLDEAVPIPAGSPVLKFRTHGTGGTDDFDDFKLDRGNGAGNCNGTFGTAAERSGPNCANVLAAKKRVYRYMWFSDHYAEDLNSSGISELSDNGGNDFMVTYAGASRDQAAGTYMHELGHDLGLGHGGRTPDGHVVNTNCKPNYFSVMNYIFQTNNPFAGGAFARPLDYARAGGQGIELREDHLSEPAGVAGPAGAQTMFGLPNGNPRIVSATGPVNWNDSAATPAQPGGIETGDVHANIDNIPGFQGGCANGDDTEDMIQQDDWSRLHYELEDSQFYDDGVTRPAVPEIDTDALVRIQPPDVRTTLAGPADVTAGGVVPVTATATNIGTGVAKRATLIVSQSGSADSTTEIGPLAAGASATRDHSTTVPCDAADLSTVVTTASTTAVGADEQADINPANDTARLVTTVHKPLPAVSIAAAPTGFAGEAIPVTLTYRNNGSVLASGIGATVELPKDVYYSAALDPTGTPRPAAVTRRADGTTQLRWTLPDLAGASAATVTFTVRPSLLTAPGTRISVGATLNTASANGCPAVVVTSDTATTVGVRAETGHAVPTLTRALADSTWTSESLARIQATDQRYDTSADGAVAKAEVSPVYAVSLDPRAPLRAELLTLYFNLAESHFANNTTLNLQVISPVLTTPATPGDAARQARQLLDAPNFDLVAATELLTVMKALNSGLLT
jgi:Domain of unknown function DUF11/CARDB